MVFQLFGDAYNLTVSMYQPGEYLMKIEIPIRQLPMTNALGTLIGQVHSIFEIHTIAIKNTFK